MALLHFYATKTDLLRVLGRVETSLAIKYVQGGIVPEGAPHTYSSGNELPNLGYSRYGSSAGSTRYLVTDVGREVIPELVRCSDGSSHLVVNQLLNPDSVVLTPGGLWKRDILLFGNVGAAANTPITRKLMNAFGRALGGEFVKVRAFHVGPEALTLLKAGKRLTGSERAPAKYDLSFEREMDS